MDALNIGLEIIRLLVPPLIVALAVWIMNDYMLKKQEKARYFRLLSQNRNITLPLRLQAYERLILLMERITPGNLLMRVPPHGKTTRQLHAELLKVIRDEFDHNLTQQVYVSNEAWEAVKTAREEIVKLINMAFTQTGDVKDGLDLSKLILEVTIKVEKMPTQVAMDILRNEARRLF
ncbi:MAG: hypothetical protein N2050_04070 [Flavobacteriales bacterium]|nr:hypothetical protein [Flavobacteriales bacterium]MCX7649715.1 hypothetical protein [Flavobacteriales bacterium]MDW8432688.1 hypothetical protein [Flavobacteriales bacterium]